MEWIRIKGMQLGERKTYGEGHLLVMAMVNTPPSSTAA